jgi:hypothetical protein
MDEDGNTKNAGWYIQHGWQGRSEQAAGPFSPVLYILTHTARLRHVRRRRPPAVRGDRALPHRLLRLQALQQRVQHPPDLGHVRVQHLRARVLAQAALEDLAQLLRHAVYLAIPSPSERR